MLMKRLSDDSDPERSGPRNRIEHMEAPIQRTYAFRKLA